MARRRPLNTEETADYVMVEARGSALQQTSDLEQCICENSGEAER
jgi:hypothetical protein